MNAIVSICHFCELHGPSVIFCTQAFRDLLDLDALTNVGALELLNSRDSQEEEQLKAEEGSLWKYGRIRTQSHTQRKSTCSNDTCIACRSFPHNEPGYISNDDSARVSYISSQYPLQSELYVLVRQACIRSLSCEVCPGREGPIYFGDEARGHVLSHTFFLRDVQARGFQRWYSILVLMKDKMLLLNSWPFIVRHLRQTITKLQENACKVCENEESKVSHRALRSAASMMDNVRKQRVAGQPRSLAELVGEGEVWQHIHSSFTWILKSGGLRLQERLVEGPPVNIYVADGSTFSSGLSVRQLYNIFGGTIFHRMVHHLLIGHQVIIRGLSTNLLLPKHCYKAMRFSPHYVDSASCNILGLHSLVKIPHVIIGNGNFCLIDVISKCENNDIHEKSYTNILNRTSSIVKVKASKEEGSEKVGKDEQRNPASSEPKDINESIKNLTFKITGEGALPARPPQVLSRIESAVGNSTLTQSTLMVYISTIIYEWINKVKVWIHVQNRIKTCHSSCERMPSPITHSQPVYRSPPVAILRSSTNHLSRSPGVPSLRGSSPGGLSMNPQDAAPQDERYQLLAALGSTEWDVPLLEFWAKNFNKYYGQEIS
ncbi:folliculin-like isoform X2 [Homarus americanus]|uniref:folliculin-like isoform X2 n=1 Tax=Homarus americanus TaxID=6706 RepID=UPI001C48D3E5|nr:folliculin-like isoform X2 [Homarus americanus]